VDVVSEGLEPEPLHERRRFSRTRSCRAPRPCRRSTGRQDRRLAQGLSAGDAMRVVRHECLTPLAGTMMRGPGPLLPPLLQ
jgi:hypothetical protein